MKARNIFALLGLTFAMGAGVAAGVVSFQAKEAQAADKTVYCRMEHGWWYSDDCVMGAYYWKSSDTSQNNSWPGERMTRVEHDSNVWKFTIPEGYDKVIFTRVLDM